MVEEVIIMSGETVMRAYCGHGSHGWEFQYKHTEEDRKEEQMRANGLSQ